MDPDQFTIALKTDGTFWSWGNGSVQGMLGLGNLTSYSSPKQVGSLTGWKVLATPTGSDNAGAISL